MDYYYIFKRKYPHIEDFDLEILEGTAKETLCHLLFPSSMVVSETNKEIAYEQNKFWLLKCMQEFIERTGITSAISYAENGLSTNFGRAQLSEALINEIVPVSRIL